MKNIKWLWAFIIALIFGVESPELRSEIQQEPIVELSIQETIPKSPVLRTPRSECALLPMVVIVPDNLGES